MSVAATLQRPATDTTSWRLAMLLYVKASGPRLVTCMNCSGPLPRLAHSISGTAQSDAAVT